jgi:hypothetical protein
VLEGSDGDGDTASQEGAELPLNLVVHSSGYVLDPTPPDAPTPAPTPAPTAPTGAPSTSPTLAPTNTPTNTPTLSPTKGPDCTNGAEDGTETDVDCGGPFCPNCEAGQRCYVDQDCKNGGVVWCGACLTCK